MKRPTFFEGVVVALTASLVGGALYAALTAAFGSGALLRLLIAGISFGYVVYLLTRSRGRIGRPTALAAWSVVAGAGWLLGLSLPLYLLLHLGTVWLIRSLYFHANGLAALLDLGLNGLGLAALIWAATLSGSLFLSIWCFFLAQALFVAIPARMRREPRACRRPAAGRTVLSAPTTPRKARYANSLPSDDTSGDKPMKPKITALALFVFTAISVVLYPMYRSAGAITPLDPRADARPRVEVVFVLDTTGSMGGLIEAAKEKIWSIATTMAQAQPAPEIRLGLVAYRDRGDAYVTRRVDL